MNVGADMAVGGLVLSGEVQGCTAGELVMKILDGKAASEIVPVIPA